MREIKFRAWDNATKKIYLVGGIVWDKGKIVEVDRDDDPEIEYPELMQYTGLKDKNGKEIYEGDIVEASGAVGIVEWLDMGKWTLAMPRTTDFPQPRMVLGGYVEKGCRVIGNIYENPDLLKEDKS